jgi:hypothetical protein
VGATRIVVVPLVGAKLLEGTEVIKGAGIRLAE